MHNLRIAVMKFLVVDGLRETRLFYKEQIESICDNAEVFQCMSAEDAIFNVIDREPDIIVTSEILSFRSSFELVRILNKIGSKIPVIVIACDNTNALQAIKNNVFDYLMMPIDKDALKKSVAKAIVYINQQLLLKYGDKQNGNLNPKILLSIARTGYKLIDSDKIAYFISNGSYSEIHYSNGDMDMSSYYLGKIETMMSNYHFMRINRQVIINLKNISRIDKQKKECELELLNELKVFSITHHNLKKLEEASNLI